MNLGVAGWIDAAGRIRARDDGETAGHLVVTPTLRDDPPTLYTRFGDWPTMLLLAAAAIAFRRRSESETLRDAESDPSPESAPGPEAPPHDE